MLLAKWPVGRGESRGSSGEETHSRAVFADFTVPASNERSMLELCNRKKKQANKTFFSIKKLNVKLSDRPLKRRLAVAPPRVVRGCSPPPPVRRWKRWLWRRPPHSTPESTPLGPEPTRHEGRPPPGARWRERLRRCRGPPPLPPTLGSASPRQRATYTHTHIKILVNHTLN